MNEILSSIVAEVQAMRSGKFIPYHKMAAAVALIVTVIFSVIFSHSTVFEGRISVIDLDGSKASVQFRSLRESWGLRSTRTLFKH